MARRRIRQIGKLAVETLINMGPITNSIRILVYSISCIALGIVLRLFFGWTQGNIFIGLGLIVIILHILVVTMAKKDSSRGASARMTNLSDEQKANLKNLKK